MKQLSFFLVLISFCDLALAARIRINSNPDQSHIYVVNPTTGQKNSIGVTPYDGDLSQLLSQGQDGNSLFLSIEKPGFDPYRLFFSSFGKNNIDLNLVLDVSKDIKIVQDLDLLVGDLFDVQRLIRGQSFSKAIEKLALLESRFPHFSVIPELQGSAYYLSREFTNALNSYRKAFALNAKNRDAYRMMLYLERRFNMSDSAQVMAGEQ